MVYYAKSTGKTGEQTTNQMHLKDVSELARQFGDDIHMPSSAWIAGRLHDFGKYSQAFQNVLHGTATNIDHAICAAIYLFCIGKTQKSLSYRLVAAVMAAHHSSLRSYASLEPELRELAYGNGSNICGTGKKAALIGPAAYREAECAFVRDFPDFKFLRLEKFPDDSPDERMLRHRMLFSCLVDADYTVSSERPLPLGEDLEPDRLLCRLAVHMDELRAKSKSDTSVNAIRDEVFRRCGDAGTLPPGLFTLTAPTGVGKTMALLHFALQHCAVHGKRRIILVLPFLTLTEQSQREYETLIPHILADHSQSRLSEEQRELAARWDAPFIITTSVRFFEGLFSAHPKDCRKLHNIAQSVILFDEAQSLPADLATATMRSVTALCASYGCTMVFSTATQPDFSALPGLKDWQPREILPDVGHYYAALRRTRVCWRLDRATPLAEIAAEMAGKDSVCTIVNLRRHAAQLFHTLKNTCPSEEHDGLFFLTTDLCPAHRSKIIDTIRERLRKHLPCRVVATQCIEAGVDLDFQTMYRALAPLEAIIQAAGRCNRNGKVPGGGVVTVFIPEDDRKIYPGAAYQRGAEIVKLLWADGKLDIHNPEIIAEYYRRLFRDIQDGLTESILAEDYEAVEQEYKLIKKQGVQVVVPYDQALFQSIRQQAEAEGVTPALIQAAAPITVSSFQEELVRQHCEQIPWIRKRGEGPQQSDFYLLTTGHEECYQPDMGLQLAVWDMDDETYMP